MTTELESRSSDDFIVVSATADGRPVVTVHGEVDLSTADEFRNAVFAALDVAPQIEIDFGPTSFIDSTGLTVLVGATRRVGFDRSAIIVREASTSVRRALTITGLDHFLDLTE